MEKISRHLRDEIDSLQTLMRGTEDNLLATSWTAALLGPFEKYETQFEVGETRNVITALHQARNRFGVNSDLADRIDAILVRHAELLPPEEAGRQPGIGAVSGAKPSRRLQSSVPEATVGEARPAVGPIDIFGHRISMEDMLACLDVATAESDTALMHQKMQQRQDDGVIQALQNHHHAEGCYLLLPRVSRIVCDGGTFPCTVSNLVRWYPRLFGDVGDLVPYRGDALIESETPEPGWAIVQPESLPETLGRSFDEQNQTLRITGPGVGLPSHMVRRRTLVEAVFDMIVCRLVLNMRIQRDTADWTSSGANRRSNTSVFFADDGIRIRDLTRATKHGILGCTPTW